MNKTIATLVGAIGSAAVIATAAPAHADGSEVGFLSSLNAFGMTIYNSQLALNTGYWICSKLDNANGVDVATQLYASSNSDIPTMGDANAFVTAAVLNLCPWQYHPGRSDTQQQANTQQA